MDAAPIGRWHPAPGSFEPQKILSALCCPSGWTTRFFMAPPTRGNRDVLPCRLAIRCAVRSQICGLRSLTATNPFIGSAQRRLLRTSRSTSCSGGMWRRSNQTRWLSTNPITRLDATARFRSVFRSPHAGKCLGHVQPPNLLDSTLARLRGRLDDYQRRVISYRIITA